MIARLLTSVRRVRSRLAGWSAAADRRFHDALFEAGTHDPFSAAYPGYITIRRFADLAGEHVPGAGAVVDLGCGPGEITCELARRFPAVRFHGVDHSAIAVKRASANATRLSLPNVTFERADLGTFSLAERVELVLMFDAFHHLVSPVEFVRRIAQSCDRFFLIEPAGDAVGRWTRTVDFDWLPFELDKIRSRIEHALGEDRPDSRTDRPAVPAGDVGRAVEHRYPLSDYETFFAGFTLSVRGTVSGLDRYPPQPEYDSHWRRAMMDTAYRLLEDVDNRMADQGLDGHAKHWAIFASRGPEAAPPRHFGSQALPARPWQGEEVRGPHDVRYGEHDVPTEMSADSELLADVAIRNESWRTWRSDADPPVHASYRWLGPHRRVIVGDGLRTRLPRAIVPGDECRIALRLKTPPVPGQYFLEIDLVEEGVTWFSEAGAPPLRVRVRVTPG